MYTDIVDLGPTTIIMQCIAIVHVILKICLGDEEAKYVQDEGVR